MTRMALIAIMTLPMACLALDPAKVTMTNYRGEAVAQASTEVYYRGDVVHFTNCVVIAGATNSATPQSLAGLTLTLTYGDGTLASVTATGTAQVATSGTWNASVTLRTNEAIKTHFQVRITDGTNTFTYPFKWLEIKSRL